MTEAANCRSIMLAFAASTGLSDPSQAVRRYLWNDAFAVCNFLTLYGQEGEPAFLQLALDLVDQVHRVLGRHREDSARQGWLSGLDDDGARLHPTLGGLRIGKRLAERKPGAAYNKNLEWDRDGQYFHYLTKWMHALYRVFRATGRDDYLRWSLELAKTTHRAFTHGPADRAPRMYWKMSTDLSRPLVGSMGQHDPLDGLMTYWQLDSAARRLPSITSDLYLDQEIAAMRAACEGQQFASGDPLGIGGLLTDTFTLAQLVDNYRLEETARLESLLHDAAYSLGFYVAQNQLSLPAQYRLAFRELGLAIGLIALGRMHALIGQCPKRFGGAPQLIGLLGELARFEHLGQIIEDFWCEPVHRLSHTWQQHADINDVMLATKLAPDAYLQL